MPLYEFKCRSCNHVFESRIGVSDPYPACEVCGQEVRKVFHPTPIIFKGSGWHITDYKRNGGSCKDGRDSSDSGSSKAERHRESPSDSKSEVTADT
jgi:putative FmdB family regulatory protein